MRTYPYRRAAWTAFILVLALGAPLALAATKEAPAPAEAAKADEGQGATVADFILAGGLVGWAIILLSFVGTGLVIDALLRIRSDRLVPPRVTEQLVSLAQLRKYDDMFLLCQHVDCLLSRIVYNTLSYGKISLADAREIMQEEGTREVTRLHQRVGTIGFIAAIAPMLGLLGTVVGMIKSFNVLGTARGAAPPEQLAMGVSQALVTTCEGLLLALPLMFFHSFLRDRVVRIGQEAAGVCDRLIRALDAGVASEDAPPPPPPPEPSAEEEEPTIEP